MFVLILFCYALLCIHSSFAIILKRKRKLVALLLLSYRCIVTKYILWLFLGVPWIGLQCVIVVFPDHTHLLFDPDKVQCSIWHGLGQFFFANETLSITQKNVCTKFHKLFST